MIYAILFQAISETLQTIAAGPKHLGANIGFIGTLLTWGQNMWHHPHLHCLVPGGSLAPGHSRWTACRPRLFLPVRVLSRLFRRLFLERLQRAFETGRLQFFSALAPLQHVQAFARYLDGQRRAEWVVYAKEPFGSPQLVLDYLGQVPLRTSCRASRSDKRPRNLHTPQRHVFHEASSTAVCNIAVITLIQRP